MQVRFAALVLCSVASFTVAQTQWAKYDSNPVFVKWGLMEAYAIGQPTCLFERDTFKMWYAACAFDHRGRMFHAWSPDGFRWTRANLGFPVLDIGAPGTWDQKWLDTPEVERDNTGYLMVFYGDTTDQPAPVGGLGSALGLAASQDGVAWQKDSANPVFHRDSTLLWQNLWVESPALLFVDDTLRMWYTAVAYEAGEMRVRIGYAWSLDGRQWTRLPTPVVDLGPSGSFDDLWVAVPAVIRHGNLYEMWYSAISSVDLAANDTIDTLRIGYATSADGINWDKYAGNPVLSTFSPPYRPEVDSAGPWAPDVVYDGTRYHMWYETKFGFSYATAPNTGVVERRRPNEEWRMTVWPNPCRDRVALRLPPSAAEPDDALILDVAGRQVLARALAPGQTVVLDCTGLPAGCYFVALRHHVRCPIQSLVVLGD